MQWARCAALFAVALTTTVAAPAADAKAHAKKRPDLVQVSVSDPPATVKTGGQFDVTDVVKNAGKKKAPKSVTTFCLNGKQTTTGCPWPVGSRNVGALKRGKRSAATVHLTAPSDTNVVGEDYWLVACGDSRRKIKESNEKNNCKLAGGKVTVVGGDPPAQNQVPGLQGSGTFSFDPVESTDIDFSVQFNQPVSGFEIWVPRSDVVFASITSRQDASCAPTADAGPYNGQMYRVVTCQLSLSSDTFPANQPVSGKMGLPRSEPPTAGMGGQLYGYDQPDSGSSRTTGPFQITGP
jgi:hypothetical protein